MVFESLLFQPRFCHLAMFIGTACKKCNNVAFIVPFVDDLQGVRIYLRSQHPFRLFIGDIITNRSIDIDEKIFHVVR